MANQAYFPSSEPAQIQWLQNYKTKIPAVGNNLGIGSELSATDQDLAFYIWILAAWNPAIQNDAQEATAYKKLIGQSPATGVPMRNLPQASTFNNVPSTVVPGVLKRLFGQIARLKMHANYTEAIGQDLQIIGQEDTAAHLEPQFTAKTEDAAGWQAVRLKFTKFGHAGVYIESRRNGGAWAFLAIDTETPYLDHAPLKVANTAETREYHLRFWDHGEPNADWTDVAKMTVGGYGTPGAGDFRLSVPRAPASVWKWIPDRRHPHETRRDQ